MKIKFQIQVAFEHFDASSASNLSIWNSAKTAHSLDAVGDTSMVIQASETASETSVDIETVETGRTIFNISSKAAIGVHANLNDTSKTCDTSDTAVVNAPTTTATDNNAATANASCSKNVDDNNDDDITADNTTEDDKICFIYKSGDDLRQDSLVLDMIKVLFITIKVL